MAAGGQRAGAAADGMRNCGWRHHWTPNRMPIQVNGWKTGISFLHSRFSVLGSG